MPSSKEMKDELRKLRKESQKPVSKMRVADVASEIERLRNKRENSPSVAATPIHKEPKKMESKLKDIKEAKAADFPVAPMEAKKKAGKVGAVADSTVKSSAKKSKLEKLMAMLGDMTDSDEE